MYVCSMYTILVYNVILHIHSLFYVNHPATDPATVARRPFLAMQPIPQMTPHANHTMNGPATLWGNYIANEPANVT